MGKTAGRSPGSRQASLEGLARLLAVAALATFPMPAHANAGVPMVFVTLPGMVVALIPVIALEAVVLCKRLALTRGSSAKVATLANLASTLFGIPMAWAVLALVQMALGGGKALGLHSPGHRLLAVTLQAPWLIPYGSDQHWMIPAATLTLLVPFFHVSWWVEYRVAKHLLPGADPNQLKKTVRDANLWSYGFLGLIVQGFLVHALGWR